MSTILPTTQDRPTDAPQIVLMEDPRLPTYAHLGPVSRQQTGNHGIHVLYVGQATDVFFDSRV